MTGRSALAAAALTCTVTLSAGQAPSQISDFDRSVTINILRQVKRDLRENYYDTTFRGIDLDATFGDGEARLRNAKSVSEATAIIADLMMRLDDSHTVFYPPARVARVRYGWRAAIVGDAAYVVDVRSGSDAEKKGLAEGDRLVAWNQFEPTRANLWQIQYLYAYVRPQLAQRVVVRKPDGTERTIDIQSAVDQHPLMQLEDLIDELRQAAASRRPDGEAAIGDILVWRIASFGDPKMIQRIAGKARNYKGLVIDLRGNGGGNVDAMKVLVSAVFDRDIQIGVVKTRKGDEPMIAKAGKEPFTGKLVILVDSRSGSASEIAARVVQLEKRGTVMGDRTAGAVMTARHFPHTTGVGSVAFWATSVTVGDVRMSDGQSLEKAGVVPDRTELPTAADLAAGRDPVLARAIALLQSAGT